MSHVRSPEDRAVRLQDGDLMVFCPACECAHWFDKRWTFSGTMLRPTFYPSMDVRYKAGDKNVRCHSWVREGRIEYCSDSTHALAGKAVDLPEFSKFA